MGFGDDQDGGRGGGGGCGGNGSSAVSPESVVSAFTLLRRRYPAEWKKHSLALLAPRLAAASLKPRLACWRPLHPPAARARELTQRLNGGGDSGDAADNANCSDGAEDNGTWDGTFRLMWSWHDILVGAEDGANDSSDHAGAAGELAWARLLESSFLPPVRTAFVNEARSSAAGGVGGSAAQDDDWRPAYGDWRAPLALLAALAPLLPRASSVTAGIGGMRAMGAAQGGDLKERCSLSALLEGAVLPKLCRAAAAWRLDLRGMAAAAATTTTQQQQQQQQQQPAHTWLLPWLSAELPWPRSVADPLPRLLATALPQLRRSIETSLRGWSPGSGSASGGDSDGQSVPEADSGGASGTSDANGAAIECLRPWLRWAAAEAARTAAAAVSAGPSTGAGGAASAATSAASAAAAELTSFRSLLQRAVLPKLAAGLREMGVGWQQQPRDGGGPGGAGGALRRLLAWDVAALMPREATLSALEGELLPRWTRALLDMLRDQQSGSSSNSRRSFAQVATWFERWTALLRVGARGNDATAANHLCAEPRLQRHLRRALGMMLDAMVLCATNKEDGAAAAAAARLQAVEDALSPNAVDALSLRAVERQRQRARERAGAARRAAEAAAEEAERAQRLARAGGAEISFKEVRAACLAFFSRCFPGLSGTHPPSLFFKTHPPRTSSAACGAFCRTEWRTVPAKRAARASAGQAGVFLRPAFHLPGERHRVARGTQGRRRGAMAAGIAGVTPW